MNVKTVKGEKKADIFLYAISTCVWCKKTKQLLDDLDVEYQYVDVDKEEGEDRKKILDQLDEFNPKHTYPTLVINNKKCIKGYKEKDIKESIEN